MRTLIVSLAVAAAALTAGTASAQDYGRDYRDYSRGYSRGYDPRWNDPSHQIWQLQNRVERATENGRLSRRQANYFLAQIAELRRLDWRFSRQGYTPWERRAIRQRTDSLTAQLRATRMDRYGY